MRRRLPRSPHPKHQHHDSERHHHEEGRVAIGRQPRAGFEREPLLEAFDHGVLVVAALAIGEVVTAVRMLERVTALLYLLLDVYLILDLVVVDDRYPLAAVSLDAPGGDRMLCKT